MHVWIMVGAYSEEREGGKQERGDEMKCEKKREEKLRKKKQQGKKGMEVREEQVYEGVWMRQSNVKKKRGNEQGILGAELRKKRKKNEQKEKKETQEKRSKGRKVEEINKDKSRSRGIYLFTLPA